MRKEVAAARFCSAPSFASKGRPQGWKKKGLEYEAHVIRWLEEECNKGEWTGFPHQWFEWADVNGGYHINQSDYFALNPVTGIIVLMEIKLTRTAEAWWQLNHLYGPILQWMFPHFEIAKIEIASKLVNVNVPEAERVIYWWDQGHPGETSFMKVKYGR